MTAKKIELQREDLISVLRDLSMIVVSFDRIGSSASALGEVAYRRATADFIDDWDVARRLARARRILSAPFSEEAGADGMDELERELQDVEYWTLSHRRPSERV